MKKQRFIREYTALQAVINIHHGLIDRAKKDLDALEQRQCELATSKEVLEALTPLKEGDTIMVSEDLKGGGKFVTRVVISSVMQIDVNGAIPYVTVFGQDNTMYRLQTEPGHQWKFVQRGEKKAGAA